MGDLVRRDAMNLDIAWIKDHERRSDEGIAFFDTAVVIHGDRCQGAGTVGVFIGRFKVDGRKIEHNLPSFFDKRTNSIYNSYKSYFCEVFP